MPFGLFKQVRELIIKAGVRDTLAPVFESALTPNYPTGGASPLQVGEEGVVAFHPPKLYHRDIPVGRNAGRMIQTGVVNLNLEHTTAVADALSPEKMTGRSPVLHYAVSGQRWDRAVQVTAGQGRR